MVKNIFLLFSALFITFISHVALAGTGAPIKKIVFFGDSLSDNGNLFYVDLGYLPKSPPYFEGRFSNGKVWSELLSHTFNNKYGTTSLNYAYGGQTAIFHSPLDGYMPYTFTMAYYEYLWDTAFRNRNNTLFVIWIGSNDYLPTKVKTPFNHDHTDDDLDGKKINELTTKVTDKIYNIISSLISSHGAKNILVINIPDLGLTPYAHTQNKVEILHLFSLAHNKKLQQRLAQLQNSYKEANIQLFDVNEVFTAVVTGTLADNNLAQKLNTTDSCWQGGYTFRAMYGERNKIDVKKDLIDYLRSKGKFSTILKADPSTNKALDPEIMATYISQSPALMEAYNVQNNPDRLCKNPDGYLFWDRVHPTAIVHTYLADAVDKYISDKFLVATDR